MLEKKAKVVCLVPSWTETFITAGVTVVGRTRFCVHPVDSVRAIPVVGGTKNFKLADILKLTPDFVVLDKEENRKEMAQQLEAHGIQVLVSHVTDLQSAAEFLQRAARKTENGNLQDYSSRYLRIVRGGSDAIHREKFWAGICLEQNAEMEWESSEYIIWKNPFMAIGSGTFIAAVFSLVGVKYGDSAKYPHRTEEDLKKKYCLFSSEPYPFAREFPQLTQSGFRGALVDGEKIGWYGIRNLIFLEESRKTEK